MNTYLIQPIYIIFFIIRGILVGVSDSEREVRPRHKPRVFSSSRNEESFAKASRFNWSH